LLIEERFLLLAGVFNAPVFDGLCIAPVHISLENHDDDARNEHHRHETIEDLV
jgi:hypothetical protein